MENMFEIGFLGTRAPLFMDIVTIIVALLPFLIMGAIFFAKIHKYIAHGVLQIILYFVSLIVVGYFEYGVRVGGGFDYFVKGSSLPDGFLLGFLIFHIIIALGTVIWWTKTLITGWRDHKAKEQSIVKSRIHHKDGWYSFIGIFMTSVTGIFVYLFLFVL